MNIIIIAGKFIRIIFVLRGSTIRRYSLAAPLVQTSKKTGGVATP
jgi:hypothetical protein